jgi:hypothetical protein
MSDEYRGVSIADILKVAGLNSDLTVNMGDPRNVAYIGPLESDADEDLAEGMASAMFKGDIDTDDEMGFEQRLVDARRMVLDEANAALFRH